MTMHMTTHRHIRSRKRMITLMSLRMNMTMRTTMRTLTPLRPLRQLLRQDTTTLKRMAMITPILTPIHTHEQP